MTETELVTAVRRSRGAGSARVARALLNFAHESNLLIRQRQASVSVRVVLGPGERPATMFVIAESGRFYTFWLDHWPRRFWRVATQYEQQLRKLFGDLTVVGPQALRRNVVLLDDLTDRIAAVTRLVGQTVERIRAINSAGAAVLPDALVGLEGEARRRMVIHRRREGWLRDARIAYVKRTTNALACEVDACGFDFEAAYGKIGKNYAQVHHLRPLSDRTGPSRTRVSELRVVCANCHSMIHVGGKSRSLASISMALRRGRTKQARASGARR